MYLLPAEMLFWGTGVTIVLCVLTVLVGWFIHRTRENADTKLVVFVITWCLVWFFASQVDNEARGGLSTFSKLFGNGVDSGFTLVGLYLPSLALLLFRNHITDRRWTSARLPWLIMLIVPAMLCAIYMADLHRNHSRALTDNASAALGQMLRRADSGVTVPLPKPRDGSPPFRKSFNEALELRKVFCDIEDAPSLQPFERFQYSPAPTLFDEAPVQIGAAGQNIAFTRLLTGYESCWFIAIGSFTIDSDGNPVLESLRLGEPAPTRDELIARTTLINDRFLQFPKRQSAIFKPLL